MRRRHFIKITASSGLVLSLTGTSLLHSAVPIHSLAQPELLNLLGDAKQVRNIGRAYRDQFPSEDHTETLVAALTENDALPYPDGNMKTRLAARIRDDFESERTVQVNGWVLALTEARQSALYSILYA